MQNLQAFLNDKKNQPIIIGGLVGVLVIVGIVLYFFVLRGDPAVDTAAVDPAATGAVDPMTGLPAGGAAPGGVPDPNAPVATPADPNAAAQPGAASGAPVEKVPPIEAYRADPFKPNFGPKPKRTKPQMMASLASSAPVIRRVAPVQIDELAVEQDTLPPQPQRRMAGFLKNSRVFAIIETEGQYRTVRPGEPLDENVSVDRILPDRVILRSTKTRTPIFIEVPKSAGTPPPDAGQPVQPTGGGPGGPRPPQLRGPRGDAPPPPAAP